jgi:hypothetical protein
MSEEGFGGQTVGNSGGVSEGGDGAADGAQTRRQQGYGDGSAVGA